MFYVCFIFLHVFIAGLAIGFFTAYFSYQYTRSFEVSKSFSLLRAVLIHAQVSSCGFGESSSTLTNRGKTHAIDVTGEDPHGDPSASALLSNQRHANNNNSSGHEGSGVEMAYLPITAHSILHNDNSSGGMIASAPGGVEESFSRLQTSLRHLARGDSGQVS